MQPHELARVEPESPSFRAGRCQHTPERLRSLVCERGTPPRRRSGIQLAGRTPRVVSERSTPPRRRSGPHILRRNSRMVGARRTETTRG